LLSNSSEKKYKKVTYLLRF